RLSHLFICPLIPKKIHPRIQCKTIHATNFYPLILPNTQITKAICMFDHYIAYIWPFVMIFCPISLLGQESTLNHKIVQFCEKNLGQTVGDGDCFDLASHALRQAGATRHFADNPNKGDHVWGELILLMEATDSETKSVGKAEKIIPGNIIQFRDAFFKRKGRPWTFKHHTAVVRQVDDNGRNLTILQQNIGGKKFVTEATIHLNDLKTGWIRVYQPVQDKTNSMD
ncbi:MAG: CHAP domain-containing protein, partial [Thermoguttaceae bacterium]